MFPRAHHKKCDETRPTCLLCIKFDRVCEYKETPDRRTRDLRQVRSSDVIARRLVDPSQTGLTPTERHYLQLFRVATSGQCAGNIVDDFWQRLIHQVSEEEPAVRHATIAISAIHWHFLQDENTPTSVPGSGSNPDIKNDISFPLEQCNKAIASLRQNLTKVHAHVTSSAHRQAVLVTCAALVSLALFQEDIKALMKHLVSGHRLLLEWEKVNFDGSSSGPILMRVFQDLQLHRMTFESRETALGEVHIPIWQKFAKACDTSSDGYAEEGTAGELLGILRSIVLANLPRRLVDGKRSRLIPLIESASELFSEHKKGSPVTIMGRIYAWKSQLQSFGLATANILSPAERTPLILIEIWTEFFYLMAIYANGHHDEMFYDAHLPSFQRINKLSKLFLDAEYQTGLFCAKVMLLPPMYFSAHRCRDWHTRRESLRLVSSSRRREGLWASAGASAGLEYFINEESMGYGPDDVIPIYSRIDIMYAFPSPNKPGGIVWYHRPSSPEEIAGGADVYGIWKTMGVPTSKEVTGLQRNVRDIHGLNNLGTFQGWNSHLPR